MDEENDRVRILGIVSHGNYGMAGDRGGLNADCPIASLSGSEFVAHDSMDLQSHFTLRSSHSMLKRSVH
jgi:hypothetical protein